MLGAAHSALPPRVEPLSPNELETSRAWQLVQREGWQVPPEFPALAQLDRALDAAEAAGMPVGDDGLVVYAAAAR
jgi:hypothetical protein